jgi:hypothetical protein
VYGCFVRLLYVDTKHVHNHSMYAFPVSDGLFAYWLHICTCMDCMYVCVYYRL